MVEKVGSYKEFISEQALEDSPESIDKYSKALIDQMLAIAAMKNINPEELHQQSAIQP
jgi:hypothetical protein